MNAERRRVALDQLVDMDRESAQCRSGLSVTRLTAVWEDQGSIPTAGSCMFFVKTTTILQPWSLHTLLQCLGRLSLLPSAGW